MRGKLPVNPLVTQFSGCSKPIGNLFKQDIFSVWAHVRLLFLITVTEGKLQVAQEHIESLEQQLADAEKKASDANQKGICFYTIRLKGNLLPP